MSKTPKINPGRRNKKKREEQEKNTQKNMKELRGEPRSKRKN